MDSGLLGRQKEDRKHNDKHDKPLSGQVADQILKLVPNQACQTEPELKVGSLSTEKGNLPPDSALHQARSSNRSDRCRKPKKTNVWVYFIVVLFGCQVLGQTKRDLLEHRGLLWRDIDRCFVKTLSAFLLRKLHAMVLWLS